MWWQNFFGLLKRERINRVRYRTREEARADVFEYIEVIFTAINGDMVFLVISVRLSSTKRQPVFMKQPAKTMQGHSAQSSSRLK